MSSLSNGADVIPPPAPSSSSLSALEFTRLRDHLVQLCESEMGQELLRTLKPSVDYGWICEELKRVEEMVNLRQRGGGWGSGALRDIRPLLKRAAVQGNMLQPDEFLTVLTHLQLHRSIVKILEREQAKMPCVRQLAIHLKPLNDLESRIESVISPEATVRDSASPELSRLRRDILIQQGLIRKKMEAMLTRLTGQGILREDSFTLRDGRYVLPVKAEALRKVRGILHDRSATGVTVFIEPAAIVDLGNELRTLELAERDEIKRLLRLLTAEVDKKRAVIETNLNLTAELDALWAKAKLGEELEGIFPIVLKPGVLRIVGGRHPLLALSGDRVVVPLNLELGGDYTTLVISGPNAGGKSVALKCVGLMCAMTACGLPVPALPGTEIPIFQEIHADIGDQQSIADDLSTFTAHARRLREILHRAGPKSLVLIDEIGAGTDPQEGASLSIAVLEKLTRQGVPTIVTTHHGALKAFAHSTPGCANGSMAFNLATFQPTYRFQPNLPGSSYALEIARRAGLPEDIITRAKSVHGRDQSQLESLIVELSEKVRHYETLTQDETQKAARHLDLEQIYTRKLEKLQNREKELRSGIKQQAAELISQARREIENIVKQIREQQASRESILEAQKALKQLSESVGGKSRETIFFEDDESIPQPPSREPLTPPIPEKSPEPGDWVMIDGGAARGQVLSTAAKGTRICVLVGAVQLWFNRERLQVVEPPEPPPRTAIFHEVPEVPLELDVRGLDSSEALARVERYIYDAVVAGRNRIGIIHGKGAGILWRHIHNFLKRHSQVASFRFGEYGEGDYGVTVVDLK